MQAGQQQKETVDGGKVGHIGAHLVLLFHCRGVAVVSDIGIARLADPLRVRVLYVQVKVFYYCCLERESRFSKRAVRSLVPCWSAPEITRTAS